MIIMNENMVNNGVCHDEVGDGEVTNATGSYRSGDADPIVPRRLNKTGQPVKKALSNQGRITPEETMSIQMERRKVFV